jgi:hypothetical protein
MNNKTAFGKWQKLFLFCLGLSIAATFCMKWMEGDLLVKGEKFTVIGLEVSYPKEKITAIFQSVDPLVTRVLKYHLTFDFIFMPGVFLGILSLCMMARIRTGNPILKKWLLAMAILQLIAWGFDITENCFLFTWLKNPVIGNEFTIYHAVVYAKWLIALLGILAAVSVLITSRKNRTSAVSVFV